MIRTHARCSCLALLIVLALQVALPADEPPANAPPAESAPPRPNSSTEKAAGDDESKKPDPAAENAAPALPPSIEQLTERVRKSLAVIVSASRDGQRDGLGSGFVISPDGLIVTNFHVIGDGRAIKVQLADGRRLEVREIHASDRVLDLAVLRVDAKDLPALDLGDSEQLKQGQVVVALGNPRGLKHSVVSGVVSGVREMDGRPMIQLAIPIEPGNSGGPLVDLQGRVQGVMTMKSLVTPNLGFALAGNLIKPLLARPNPIPMSRWLTIGALDARQWKPLMGAHWRQRSGRIMVEGAGEGFGGRALCLAQQDVPERPFELTVGVQLKDESGAAGLAFCSDGEHRHYGFYPTNGRLRLTRFDGPDLSDWTILYDQPSRHYVAGGFNTLRVRLEGGKIRCFVNDESVVELADGGLSAGKAGLVKFRDTQATFRNFKVGREVPRSRVPASDAGRIAKLVEGIAPKGPLDAGLVAAIAAEGPRGAAVLRERADQLDKQAAQLRHLAQTAYEQRVIGELTAALAAEDADDSKIDLFRAGLLVARLDNEEVEIEAYCAELDEMAAELAAKLPADAAEPAKLEALRKFMFEDHGFHGSRGDYYNRSNSYLNEVLDDREGLPITLSVVYIELARRIGLNVVGIGLPGHFVVQHMPVEGEPQLIDVFEGAKPLSRAEAVERLGERKLTDAEWAPMKKRAIIGRMLGNLLGVANNDRTVHRYLNAMLAIEPANGRYHWLRAIVRARLEEPEQAKEDVAWLLEHETEGVDMDRVKQLQQALEQM